MSDQWHFNLNFNQNIWGWILLKSYKHPQNPWIFYPQKYVSCSTATNAYQCSQICIENIHTCINSTCPTFNFHVSCSLQNSTLLLNTYTHVLKYYNFFNHYILSCSYTYVKINKVNCWGVSNLPFQLVHSFPCPNRS